MAKDGECDGLPDAVEDDLLDVLDGPMDAWPTGVAALVARHPTLEPAIAAYVAAYRAQVTRTTARPARPGGDDPPPGQLGPYRVVGVLGEGGMGTVYRAEQQDPRRLVAIKVIKPGMDSREVVARFELERRGSVR